MTEFIRDKAGASEAQQKKALAYLFAQDSTGLATDGVLAGLQVSQTGTASASVLVGAGAGVSQDTVGNGASLLVSDSQKTLDILTANPMGATPRNDIVVFDSATSSIRVIVGTPNAVPTDPTVPATAVALARLRHAASATTVPTAKIDDLRVFTSIFGTYPKPAAYTSVGGGAPIGTISNTAGTILQTLTIPAVPYARSLSVKMVGYIATTNGADSWEIVGTVDSSDVTIGVCGRFRVSQSATGSGSFSATVAQPANTAKTLRVWVRRISGTGTGTGSTDETYTHIDVVAYPV